MNKKVEERPEECECDKCNTIHVHYKGRTYVECGCGMDDDGYHSHTPNGLVFLLPPVVKSKIDFLRMADCCYYCRYHYHGIDDHEIFCECYLHDELGNIREDFKKYPEPPDSVLSVKVGDVCDSFKEFPNDDGEPEYSKWRIQLSTGYPW